MCRGRAHETTTTLDCSHGVDHATLRSQKESATSSPPAPRRVATLPPPSIVGPSDSPGAPPSDDASVSSEPSEPSELRAEVAEVVAVVCASLFLCSSETSNEREGGVRRQS